MSSVAMERSVRAMAGLLLLLVLVLAEWEREKMAREVVAGAPLSWTEPAAVLTSPVASPVAAPAWPAPPARDGFWAIDLFTAPTVYREVRSGRFAATPWRDVSSTPIRLLAVQQTAFPFQLVGSVGAGERMQGVFANLVTGQTGLAGPGALLSGTAWRVERVRELLEAGDAVAVADLRHGETGQTVELRTHQPPPRLPARARLWVGGSAHELQVGAVLESAGERYRLDEIQLEPPAVAVLWQRADGTTEVLRLEVSPKFAHVP